MDGCEVGFNDTGFGEGVGQNIVEVAADAADAAMAAAQEMGQDNTTDPEGVYSFSFNAWLVGVGVLGLSGFAAAVYYLRKKYEEHCVQRAEQRREMLKQLAIERAKERAKHAPVLNQLANRTGDRQQSMRWVAKTLREDPDGDFAHDFLGPFEFHG